MRLLSSPANYKITTYCFYSLMPSADSLLLALTLGRGKIRDHTAILQQLINKNSGKEARLPAGTFNVRTLSLPKSTKLLIGKITVLIGLPTDKALPILDLKTGSRVEGTGIIDANRKVRKRGTGVSINSAQNVTVSGVRIRETAEQGIQVVSSRGITLDNLKVTGCGTKGVEQYQAINIVISQNIQVTKCQITQAMHGIQWWGDDTNGFCENLRINGNKVSQVTGGIWGNKGRDVRVTYNTIDTCSDVGVDFEHSFNCSAVGNVIRNCKNYALAIFYASEKIVFSKNQVYQGALYGHGIGLCGDGKSKRISFLGDSINTKGPNACGLITVGSNVAEDVLLQGNNIVTEGKDGIPIRILENSQFQIIDNPLIAGVSSVGISLEGSSRNLITGNVITHRGVDKTPIGQRGGIFVYFRSSEFPAHNNRVQNNTISNYSTGINDDCWGDVNSGNVFERNITPNISHKSAAGIWGGKVSGNRTKGNSQSPVRVKEQ